MRYQVYQIHLTAAERDLVNDMGWEGAVKQSPRVGAYMGKMFPESADFRANLDEGYYEHVANVTANDLENVFHIGNMGPEEQIERLDQMHSISVGDILVDENGAASVVAGFGFEEI